MRTSMNLPDALYREARELAVREGRTVTAILEEALQRYLAAAPTEPRSFRLRTLGRRSDRATPIDVAPNAALRDLLDDDPG